MTTNEEFSGERRDENSATEHVDGILANRRRRYLLYCLCLYANPMRLPDIADQVAVWEHLDLPDSYERERLRVYNSLYHDHLPVLRAADFVEYHQGEDIVELGPAVARFEPALYSSIETEIDDLLEAEAQSMTHD